MSENLPNIVAPGDLLGTAEEFLPGPGTYEDGGRIFAALFGRPRVDPQERAVEVLAIHGVPRLAPNELVYARVDEIKTAMAVCTIVADAKTGRGVPANPEGTVHVSKAKEGFTESLQQEFAPGDILLATVLQSRPSVKLSTAAPNLGVVAARCQVCHGPLIHEGQPRDLHCPRCGHREQRKVARAYGSLLEAGEGDHGPRHS